MERIEAETEEEIRKIFEGKRRRLGVEARLEVGFLDHVPIVGKNVYGEAFPFERPSRVRIEVFAPDATIKEITEIVCEELLHIKHPGISEEEIAKMVLGCVGSGASGMGTKGYSKETEEMLRLGRGYNCESYGEFYGPQPFKKVLEHEVEDMYNVHVLEETCRELGIRCRGLEDPANIRVWMEAAEREIERRFGADSKAIWLGTRSDVRTRYCTPGEKPVQYAIPKGAMVMSDLGSDGTLFLFPSEEVAGLVPACVGAGKFKNLPFGPGAGG